MNLRQELFRFPTRVSRFYPLMTLALMFSSSAAVYAWQDDKIRSGGAVKERDAQIIQLQGKVKELSANTEVTVAAAKVQEQQAVEAKKQLQTATGQLQVKQEALKAAQDKSEQVEAQITQQQSQLATNSKELQQLRARPPLFSFQNKSSLSDVDGKQAAVRRTVEAAYAYAQDLYGPPYALQSITITFVNALSIAGSAGETQITTGPQGASIDIRMKDFDPNSFQDVNTIIHEMMHAFHGISVLESSALEEGMVVAATDAIMMKMIAAQALPAFPALYLNATADQLAKYEQQLTIRAGNEAFYADPLVAKEYQLVGASWMSLYAEDPMFFKKFNALYYPEVQAGRKVDAAGARDLIRQVLPSVGGVPAVQFLAGKKAFNPA